MIDVPFLRNVCWVETQTFSFISLQTLSKQIPGSMSDIITNP